MNNIRIGILSADNTCVGHLDNSTEEGLHYFKDSFTDYLEGAAGVFTFTAPAKHPESQYLIEGNKLAFVYQNRDRYYTIVKSQPSEHTIDVTAYSLCLDLINEQSPAYEAAAAMTFAQYLAAFCDEDYLVLNRNEVTNKAIKHKWDGTSTLLARLYSLATVFEAEIEFLPVLRADYTLDRIEVNVYAQHDETHQGIGEARQDVVMQYGKNVKSIRKTSDITGLYTSIYATGKDGVDISGIARTVTDADGQVLYFTEAGSPVLYAKAARDRYPSSVSEDGGYIQYSPGTATEYETAEALYGYMLGRLKVISQPAVSYEVDGYEALNVGDTVLIKDEEFNPPLYLAARVSQQKWSVTQPELNKTTFDNFTEYVSQVSSAPNSSAPVDIVARTAARSASLAAYNARQAAQVADTKAVAAQTAATEAKTAIETQEQYFWHDTEGAHVSNTADGTSGKNVLVTSEGMAIRDGSTVLAEFKADDVNLLQHQLELRALVTSDTGRQAIQAQIRKVVDAATATNYEELGVGIDVRNWEDDPDITRNPDTAVLLRYNPTTKRGEIGVIANAVRLENVGGVGYPPQTAGRIVANGYEIMTEYTARATVPLDSTNNRNIYLWRIGRTVQATIMYLGPFAAGLTSLGVVIPEGYRPMASIFFSSTKLIKPTTGELTTSTEVVVEIRNTGEVVFHTSAAADALWGLALTVNWLCAYPWPSV